MNKQVLVSMKSVSKVLSVLVVVAMLAVILAGSASAVTFQHPGGTGMINVDINPYDPNDTSIYPNTVNPYVETPIVEGIDITVPGGLGNTALANKGFVDVTAAPFNADETGVNDATNAINNAIKFARNEQMIVFFPVGTYKVSNTLHMKNGVSPRSHLGLLLNSPEFPPILMGSNSGGRAKIKLAANSPGFNDPNNPKSVVHFYNYDITTVNKDQGTYQLNKDSHAFNDQTNNVFANIDIEISSGNAGAIGINSYSAEGGYVQDVTIDAGTGFAGMAGVAGNGGGWTNITINGGKYGIYSTESSVPSCLYENITINNPTQNAIVTRARGTVAMVGIKITMNHAAPAILQWPSTSAIFNTTISLIDSQIIYSTSANCAAIAGTTDGTTIASMQKGLYLNNVYVQRAAEVVKNELTGNQTNWVQVKEFATGKNYTDTQTNETFYEPVYINGVKQGVNQYSNVVNPGATPPADLCSKHGWTSLPTFETAGAVSVKAAPYNAVGNGFADDTAKIQQAIDENEIVFLPKGYYNITNTLKLKPNTKLIGAAHAFTNIIARNAVGFQGPNYKPMVETANDPNAETIICNLSIRTPVDTQISAYPAGDDTLYIYAIKWQSGYKSIMTNVQLDGMQYYGFKGQSDPTIKKLGAQNPMVLITGNGGGRIYHTFYEAPLMTVKNKNLMRILAIRGTSQPLTFYNSKYEHLDCFADIEISNSSNVTFYGSKTESPNRYMDISNSDNIRIFGHGGNGTGDIGGELFKLTNVTNFIITNISDQFFREPEPPGGKTLTANEFCPNYYYYTALRDGTFAVPYAQGSAERPVMYKKGNPTSATPPPVSSGTIFEDGFESGAFTGYNNTTNCTVVSDNHYEGSYSAQLRGLATLVTPEIDASSYSSVAVNYARKTGATWDSTKHLSIQWWNGTAWVTPKLEDIAVLTGNWNSTDETNYVTFTLTAAQGACHANFKLRFMATGTTDTDYAFVDSISVVGTP